jgi:integrase
MYELISYISHDHNKKCWTLFDQATGLTPMYPMIYSALKLAKRETSTQRRHMTALVQLYQFINKKHNDSFESFFQLNGLRGLIGELDGFSAYIEAGGKAVNIVSLNADAIEVGTSRIRISDIFIFLNYMNNRYTTAKYDSSWTPKGIGREQTAIKFLLLMKKEDLTSSASKRSPVAVLQEYKSLTPFQLAAFLKIIYPSTPVKVNEKNPFKDIRVSFRNYLIGTLMLEYGLRRAEVSLLETDSFKPSLYNLDGDTSYYLIVTDCDEEEEAEGSIKTETSHRTLKITETHYKYLCAYVDLYRLKLIKQPDGSEIHEECDSSILFLSTQKPKPLSLRMYNKMFEQLTQALYQHFNKLGFSDPVSMEYILALYPHLLRHTWAVSQLYLLVDVQNMSITDAKDLLRINGGWAIKSDMPDHYGRRFLADKANAANLRHILQGEEQC